MALRIDDETERLLTRLADEAGETKAATVRRALLREGRRREALRQRRVEAQLRRVAAAGP